MDGVEELILNSKSVKFHFKLGFFFVEGMFLGRIISLIINKKTPLIYYSVNA